MSSTQTELGYSKRGPLAANIVCHLEGRNLLETICLNMCYDHNIPTIWQYPLLEPSQVSEAKRDRVSLHPYTPFSRAVDLRGGPEVGLIGYAAGIFDYAKDPMLCYDEDAIESDKGVGGFFHDMQVALSDKTSPEILQTGSAVANQLPSVTFTITTAKGYQNDEQYIDVWHAQFAATVKISS